MYKIIALDVDGTLLNDEKKITQKTKDALFKARNMGIKIVLSSGRPLQGLTRYLEELDLYKDDEYVLSYNGSLVQEVKSAKIIHRLTLNGKDLKYLYNLSKEVGVNIHAFSTKQGLITPKISKYTQVESQINGIDINVIDFLKIGDNEEIVKIMLIEEPEILDKAIKKLPSDIYNKYTVVKSAPFFLEFINKNSDKGKGLEALSRHLGVSRNEIMSFGDAGNDIAMIKYAGMGIAMGNATDDVKKAADFITCTNEEDGVSKAIEKYVF